MKISCKNPSSLNNKVKEHTELQDQKLFQEVHNWNFKLIIRGLHFFHLNEYSKVLYLTCKSKNTSPDFS